MIQQLRHADNEVAPRDLVEPPPRGLVDLPPRDLVDSYPRDLFDSSPRDLVDSSPRDLVDSSPRDLVATEGPFRAPSFGGRHAPVALILAPHPDPILAALATHLPTARPDAATSTLLRAFRALPPDPGAAPAPGTSAARLLAGLSGIPQPCSSPDAPWNASPEALFAAILAATRWADPFRARPWSAAEGLAQLAAWREAEAAHRGIAAATGIEWFKHRRVVAALASSAGPPCIVTRGSTALRHARAAGGSAAIWSAVMPPGLPARATAAGVTLLRIEDGFLRSAGLGVHLVPAASMVFDDQGIHYDPATPSRLETLLATHPFPPALVDRAARLREAIVAANVTKYNLPGGAPALALPPGRRVILVPGQAEDDAALRRGGGRLRRNIDLLRAVRAGNPDAIILYKPHPDVAAGMRRGAIPPAAAAGLADHVLPDHPIGALYPLADELHTIASLAGFEALLRGLRVVTHGQPFYAGWGLTEDRDPPPRRGRALPLDALVAAALILYQRCWDPVTGLPCPPELVVERLAAAAGGASPPPPRSPAWLRGFIGRCSRFLAEWFADR